MATLLDDLRAGLGRFLYTIDDCYSKPSLLQWDGFLAEIAEELQPLEKAVGSQPNPLELVQKYYRERVDNTAILNNQQQQIEQQQQLLATSKQNHQTLKKQLVDTEQKASQQPATIQQQQQHSQKLQKELQALSEEYSRLQELAATGSQEQDYKKLLRNLEQASEDKKQQIAQSEQQTQAAETQLWEYKEQIGQLGLQLQQNEQQQRELEQLINQLSQKRQAAANAEEVLIEKEAFSFLEKLFKSVLGAKDDSSEHSAESFILKNDKVPKIWKSILNNLLSEPIPSVAGALRKRKKGGVLPYLERADNIKLSEELLAGSLLALKRTVVNKTDDISIITQSERLYLPVGAGICAKISFREKGRFIQNFQPLDENGLPSGKLEIFANLQEAAASDNAQSHAVHNQLTVQTVQDLYLLYGKYVIEIDFRPASILL